MESSLSHVIASSELAPVNGKGATPFAQQTVVLTKQAYIELLWQAHYWRAQYQQLVERETALKAEVEAQQATAYSTDFCHPVHGNVGSWPIYVNAEEVSQFEWISEPTLTR